MSATRLSAALAAVLACAALAWRRTPPLQEPEEVSAVAAERAAVVALQLPKLLAPNAVSVVLSGMPEERTMRRLACSLRSDGLVAVRLRVAEADALRPALRRALRHFSNVTVWRTHGGETVLLASRRRLTGARWLDEAFRRESRSARLRPLGLSYPATLLSLEAAGERTARRLAWSDSPATWRLVDDRSTAEGRADLLLSRYLEQRRKPLQPREYLEILLHPREPEERPVFRSLLEEWVRRYPRDPRALAFLYVVEEREGRSERAARLRARLDTLRGRRTGPPRREIILPNG